MIRVLVAHGEGDLGTPVRVLLEAQPDMAYVGTLTFGHDLVDDVEKLRPAIIVIDTDCMVSQVLPIADELHARVPACALLVLCDVRKRGMLPPRRQGGALHFLPKGASNALLADSVRRLAAGERVVCPRSPIASLNTRRGLSARELEVLKLTAEGESVNEIADRLCLSGGTVRNYLSNVITKTGARNRLDAIRILRNDGWLR